MFCTKCGAQIDDNAKFCSKCGAPAHMPEPQTESAPMVFPVVEEQGSRMPEGSDQQKDTIEQTKKPGSGKLIALLLILIVLLIGGIGGGAWYFLGQHEPEEGFREEDDDGGKDRTREGKSDEEEDGGEEGEAKEEAAEEGEESKESDKEQAKKTDPGDRKPVSLNIHQVDNSNFPEVTFYASVVDENNDVVDSLGQTDFTVQEISTSGEVIDVTLNEVYKVLNEDTISVNLVLDASGSMDSWSKMEQAKSAANTLVSQMELSHGDQVEIISFDDYVYLQQDFTRDQALLEAAINNITPRGSTALYDALYAGLYQTYYESGVKCVIGFTDGMENCSSYTFDDVVAMAQNTSIPVFIIGIGEEYDVDALKRLAMECSGEYYSANVQDLESILTDIYLSIYEQQQDYYVFKYTSSDESRQNEFRDIVLSTSETTEFDGAYTKEYVPQSDISGAFASDYMDMDYMLDFSSQREVTDADLQGMSLAQLRIARNEIFARHGRQFRDKALNQWFYSKTWYLNLPDKYSPDDFDGIRPSPLSKLEIENVEYISNYEQFIMENSDIYPDASNTVLSDYDLALSKAVLKNALAQMQGYSDTAVLRQNMLLVQAKIDEEDIEY